MKRNYLVLYVEALVHIFDIPQKSVKLGMPNKDIHRSFLEDKITGSNKIKIKLL